MARVGIDQVQRMAVSSLYFFRIHDLTWAPRLVKTIWYRSFSTVVSASPGSLVLSRGAPERC